MDTIKYRREFCCGSCGLIWFSETSVTSDNVCPECNNRGDGELGIFPCDSMGFVYAYDSIIEVLKQKQKKIHYHEEHPLYETDDLSNKQNIDK